MTTLYFLVYTDKDSLGTEMIICRSFYDATVRDMYAEALPADRGCVVVEKFSRNYEKVVSYVPRAVEEVQGTQAPATANGKDEVTIIVGREDAPKNA